MDDQNRPEQNDSADGDHELSGEEPTLSQDSGLPMDFLPELEWRSGNSEAVKAFSFPNIDGLIIESELGRGAHGQVYKAIDNSIKPPVIVAVKLLNLLASQRHDLRDRFDREIVTYNSLRGANVIRPLNHGHVKKGAYKDCPYLVMEYMDGGTFGQWMKTRPSKSRKALKASVQILIEACRGLAELHENGIVHRDLKPDNILLHDVSQSEDGAVARHIKISDFGLVANLGEQRELSRTGMTVGTPAYMSPEQFIDAKNLTAATDQFAIGVMLYQLLAARRPWQSSADEMEEQGVIEAKARSKTPCPPPSSGTRKVDHQLKEVCLRCLEPDPQERYPHINQLRESLEAWVHGELDPHSRNWLKRTWRTRILHPVRRRPGRFLARCVVALAVVLAGAWTGYQYAYVWPSETRYASVTNFEGTPRGLGELSYRASKNRAYYYAFFRQGCWGAVDEIKLVNSDGALMARAPLTTDPLEMFQDQPDFFLHAEVSPLDVIGRRPVHWTYDYDDAGELLRITELDSLGHELTRRQFLFPTVVEYSELRSTPSLAQATATSLNQGFSAIYGVDWGTDIEQIQIDWDRDGLCQRKIYFGRDRKPTVDALGALGWQYDRDDQQRIVARTAIGPDGEPMNCDLGFSKEEIDYTNGVERHTFFDRHGNEAIHAGLGASRVRFEYAATGQVTLVETYVLDRLTQTPFGGPVMRFDWKEDSFAVRHFDPELEPTHRGDGVFEVQGTFQKNGLIEVVSYLGKAGEEIQSDELGASRLELHYDELNRIQSLEMQNADCEPQRGAMGASKFVFSWDAFGMPTGMGLFHAGKPVLGRFLAHRTVIEYDEAQRQKSWSCWGVEQDERVDCMMGFHAVQKTYDTGGRLHSIEYRGADGSRKTHLVEGYHRAEWEFDTQGNEIAWQSFDQNNLPRVDDGYGCHRIERTYDQNHHETSVICFDGERRRTLDRKGICEYRQTWVEGQIASTAAFDTTGEAMNVPGTRWHRWTHEKTGETTLASGQRASVYERRYWNIANEPVLTEAGYHLERSVEDEEGRLLKGSYFDESDQVVMHAAGYHRWKIQVSDRGEVTDAVYLDSDDQPLTRVARVRGATYSRLQDGDFIYGKDGEFDPIFIDELLGNRDASLLDSSLNQAAEWLGLGKQGPPLEVIRNGEPMTIKGVSKAELEKIIVDEFFTRVEE